MLFLKDFELKPEAPLLTPPDLGPIAIHSLIKQMVGLKAKYTELISQFKATRNAGGFKVASNSSSSSSSALSVKKASTTEGTRKAVPCSNCRAHGLGLEEHHYTECPHKK